MSYFSDPKIMKTLIATGVAFSIDKFVFMQPDSKKSLVMAVSTSSGILAAAMLSPYLPDLSSMSSSLYNGNTIENRVLSIALGTGIGYGVHTFIIKNEGGQVNVLNKIMLIAATDFISEYATDYLTTQPLSYLI